MIGGVSVKVGFSMMLGMTSRKVYNVGRAPTEPS